jgi:hypothetical protein|nr:MAG TPA: hypothetical protein [Caudoviricetes sp.]
MVISSQRKRQYINEQSKIILAFRCEQCPKVCTPMCERKCVDKIISMLKKKYENIDYIRFCAFKE